MFARTLLAHTLGGDAASLKRAISDTQPPKPMRLAH
jgi:hypothetical protein